MSDEDWEMEEMAISAIRITLHNEILFNIMNVESAPKLWAKLETIYISKSLTNKLFLKKQLYSLKITKGSQLSEHLNEFNKIVIQLLSLDVKIEDKDKALLFLSSLPPIVQSLGDDVYIRERYFRD